jgi:predicted transcriptional regulator
MASRLHELGELQLAVMNVLWTRKQASVHDVIAALPQERKPAYTTILTVLRNLEKRGFVNHEAQMGSRMHLFRPIVSSHDARGDILHDVLTRLFAGSPAMLIKHLLETEGFSITELHDIQQTIERQERQARTSRNGAQNDAA